MYNSAKEDIYIKTRDGFEYDPAAEIQVYKPAYATEHRQIVFEIPSRKSWELSGIEAMALGDALKCAADLAKKKSGCGIFAELQKGVTVYVSGAEVVLVIGPYHYHFTPRDAAETGAKLHLRGLQVEEEMKNRRN